MKANYQITLVCDNCDTAMVYEPELSQHHEDVMCQVCGCVEMRKPTNVEEILFDKASQAMNQMRSMKAENDSLKKASVEIRKRMAAIEKRMKIGEMPEEVEKALDEQALVDMGTTSDDPESIRYDQNVEIDKSVSVEEVKKVKEVIDQKAEESRKMGDEMRKSAINGTK